MPDDTRISILTSESPPCNSCSYQRGESYTRADGYEHDIKPGDPAWELGLIAGTYCFIADLFNSSDEKQTRRYVDRKEPIPVDCPKGRIFKYFKIQ